MGTNCDREKNLNEIERQLHEQYAVNNNSYLGHIVSLVGGLFAVLGLYGNVFIKSNLLFEKADGYEYTMGDLFIAAAFAYIALGIMAYLCIYLGMHQRHEHFVVWAIRKKFYGKDYVDKPKIYYEDYIPFVKKPFAIIKELYGEFVKIISLVTLCILVSLIIKVGLSIHNNGFCCEVAEYYSVPIVVHIIAYFICLFRFWRGKEKYRRLAEEYEEVCPAEAEKLAETHIIITIIKYFAYFFIPLSLFSIKEKKEEKEKKGKIIIVNSNFKILIK